MWTWRTAACLAALITGLSLNACQSQTKGGNEPAPSPKAAVIELSEVDTSKLTAREKEQWSSYVGELLAPCSDQPVSIAQCVTEKRDCEACAPAARFLAKQVTKGKTRSQAETAFRLRFSPDEVKSIEVGESPAKGSAEAPVTIVEWADFECPFCGMASPLLDTTVTKFPNSVRLVFKHYPLSIHEHAEGAARAAVAAGMQGKFWEMHHELFTHQQQLDEPSLERLARQLGLDVKRFNEDRKGEAAADKVTADRKQGDKLGLHGTPMIYINGRHFDLEHFNLAEDLDEWIQLEVKLRTGKQVAPAQEANGAVQGAAARPSGASSKPSSEGSKKSERPATTKSAEGG